MKNCWKKYESIWIRISNIKKKKKKKKIDKQSVYGRKCLSTKSKSCNYKINADFLSKKPFKKDSPCICLTWIVFYMCIMKELELINRTDSFICRKQRRNEEICRTMCRKKRVEIWNKKQRKRRGTSKEKKLLLIATKVKKVMKVIMSLSNNYSSLQKTINLIFFALLNIKEMCQVHHKTSWHVSFSLHFFRAHMYVTIRIFYGSFQLIWECICNMGVLWKYAYVIWTKHDKSCNIIDLL